MVGTLPGGRLVLDELHTYRGRQGADVALLVRRLRERLKADQTRVHWHGHHFNGHKPPQPNCGELLASCLGHPLQK